MTISKFHGLWLLLLCFGGSHAADEHEEVYRLIREVGEIGDEHAEAEKPIKREINVVFRRALVGEFGGGPVADPKVQNENYEKLTTILKNCQALRKKLAEIKAELTPSEKAQIELEKRLEHSRNELSRGLENLRETAAYVSGLEAMARADGGEREAYQPAVRALLKLQESLVNRVHASRKKVQELEKELSGERFKGSRKWVLDLHAGAERLAKLERLVELQRETYLKVVKLQVEPPPSTVQPQPTRKRLEPGHK